MHGPHTSSLIHVCPHTHTHTHTQAWTTHFISHTCAHTHTHGPHTSISHTRTHTRMDHTFHLSYMRAHTHAWTTHFHSHTRTHTRMDHTLPLSHTQTRAWTTHFISHTRVHTYMDHTLPLSHTRTAPLTVGASNAHLILGFPVGDATEVSLYYEGCDLVLHGAIGINDLRFCKHSKDVGQSSIGDPDLRKESRRTPENPNDPRPPISVGRPSQQKQSEALPGGACVSEFLCVCAAVLALAQDTLGWEGSKRRG